jgi:hypothetical protein
MTMRSMHHARALVVAAVGVALACEPIVGTPSPAAPMNVCPAHACNAYKQPGAAPTCNDAGVCTIPSQTTNLLLVIALATDSYLAPGRTYLTTLSSATPAPASCEPPSCCELPDCSPPECKLPEWKAVASSYFLAPSSSAPPGGILPVEANWYLGNSGTTALPVQATFRRRFGPTAASSQDALDLGLPVDPVLAVNVVLPVDTTPPGPKGTAPIQFQTYLQPGCYERTLQPFSPFSRAFPPEIYAAKGLTSPAAAFLWPPDDPSSGLSGFDLTKETSQGPTVPKFDIRRAEGLEGWTAYLRNVQTKRVFSNVVPLTGSLAHDVTLLSNHEPDHTVDALTGLEVVLAPPSGQPLPTEVFAPTAQELASSLPPYPSLPTPVTMSGRIRTPAGSPVPADVYFTATDITARSGQSFPPNFEFTTRVSTTRVPETGASAYSVLLPQGHYQIAVRPTDGVNALTVASRPVGGQGNEMTGEDFDVTPLVQLSGSAVVADLRDLAEAIVEALPTQCAATVGDGAAADSSDACLPRTAQTVTANDGSFQMLVDPGGYLLRVRPREGSRLPWKISPIVVGTTSMVLPPIMIPAPLSVGMRLTDSAGGLLSSNNNPVPNAIVRVFTDPSQPSQAAPVELGQAITDSMGNYEMYIAPPDQ